jgi:hypothetical protein
MANKGSLSRTNLLNQTITPVTTSTSSVKGGLRWLPSWLCRHQNRVLSCGLPLKPTLLSIAS